MPEEIRPRSYSSPVQKLQVNDSLEDSRDDSSTLDFNVMDHNNVTLAVNDFYLLESIMNNNSCQAEILGNQWTTQNELFADQNHFQNSFNLQNDSFGYSN